MIEKRRKLRRSGSFADIEEDDPEKVWVCLSDCQKRHAIYVQICKLFADLERLRVEEELRQSNER